ncbi:MAG: hypothetical protein AAB298_02750 [Pseudomonadota bacterium]|jgi:hypothetical protein
MEPGVTSEQPARLKILHLLNDGGDELSARIIAAHARDHQVRVVNLRDRDISFEQLVDEIFAHDKVVSW